ncbi:tripartite tricarboxylate transporter permease [uncultured Bilophila sp.]|uniref:tripartite tricarboxylate transporter permease n=1 Tax=uncultured Bilophila sp. TaxID=529385 RepID=UPI0025DA40C1|nr:tripartite tricarboxylate transporter permease [uncultured Bilophila sp.]
MDMVFAWFSDMGAGISAAMSVGIFSSAFIGVVIGVFIGVIPGLGPAVTIALAIPLTFSMGPLPAIALFLGIYKGGTYGGSISAILINTPGTPAAAATVLDGYPMAKQGKSGKALNIALFASVFGDTFGIFILCMVAQPLAQFALRFGPTELCSLLLFAMTMIAVLSGKSLLKGITAAFLGIMFGTIGMDPIAGETRYSFGLLQLEDRLPIIPMVIGLFAVAEVLLQMEEPRTTSHASLLPPPASPDDARATWKEIRHCLPIFFRSSCIGAGIGALPGTGSTTAAFLSYGVAKERSKKPDLFGKGSIEGLAAAESGNNAVCGGALVPMLSLGIPGDDITAILMGGMIIHGINVGPQIFTDHRAQVYTLFGMLLISVFMLLFVGKIMVAVSRRLANMPQSVVMPLVLLLCVMGAYGVNFAIFDCWLMLFFGLMGYGMVKLGFPLPPMLIAFILSPQIEFYFRQSLMLSNGNMAVFVTKPLSVLFLLMAVGVIGHLGYSAVSGRSGHV